VDVEVVVEVVVEVAVVDVVDVAEDVAWPIYFRSANSKIKNAALDRSSRNKLVLHFERFV
jgi:hypothetical protein